MMMDSSSVYAAYYDTSSAQSDVVHAHEQLQQPPHPSQTQFWDSAAAAGYCTSNSSDAPIFSHPFDVKHAALEVQVAQPSHQPAFDDAIYSAHHDLGYSSYGQPAIYDQQQQQFFAPGPTHVFVDSAYAHQHPTQHQLHPHHFQQHHQQSGYYAPSPTLSDLSSLSSGPSGSPLSPPHLLTPVSPVSATPPTAGGGSTDGTLLFAPSPAQSHMMLPPLPLEATAPVHQHQVLPPSPAMSSASMSSRSSDGCTPPAVSTPTAANTAPSTSSTGPAVGEFAVLTVTGHTIAASASYKDVLSAARSVRKADQSGLVDDSRTCPYCGKVCDRPSTLKTHLNSHTGARPHVCTVPACGRQFTVLSNMYRHAKVCAAQRARDARRAAAALRR